MSEGLSFLFGIHNHQPVGNFDSVVREATARAYHPFLTCMKAAAPPPVTVHCSGGLLAWMREHARPTFDLLGALAADRRVEFLTGGFYEPVLPMLPDWDKVGQVQALTEFLRAQFGARPRGIWLAERVWEPHLPKVLSEAGVEFIVVDDQHFALAGLDPETLGGYYLTEEQGTRLAVFPISQRLRYLVPFAEPAETLRYLEERRGAGSLTLVDDGEKFGVWPGTDTLCYGEGWLRRFLEALGSASGLTVSTFSRYLDACPPKGRVYLPTASYAEMGEWALPAAAAEELEEAKQRLAGLPDGERLIRLLRGGFWRGFLAKYPEVADTYWKMLSLSRVTREALAARPADPALLDAREALWRGQANDAYWHGIFGGCYLPHLRRAVRSSLIAAEARLVAAGVLAPVSCQAADHNGDGRLELRVRTRDLALTLNPEAGGTLTELVFFPAGMDLADVLARRREGYHGRLKEEVEAVPAGAGDGARSIHGRLDAKETGLAALLQYDTFRRASLLDGLFAAGPEPLDALHPWEVARLALGSFAMRPEVREAPGEIQVALSLECPDGIPLAIAKSVTVHRTSAHVSVGYRLRWDGTEPLVARWGVQWNLTLTAGDAFGRYYRLPGWPSLGSRGLAAGQRGVAMVDEWLGCELGLVWPIPADLGWAPVETVSLSEAGFERIYQGSALLLVWPLLIAPGEAWETHLTLSLKRTGGP